MKELLSEFEDLLRIKEFGNTPELRTPYLCTYEKIAKALKEEYQENIDEKVHRWIDVTYVQYFDNVKSVTYFFQAKMLYRDGFYESAIMLCRSIAEMICYELLNRCDHPFGDLSLIEVSLFRIYIDFLFLPKKINKNAFESEIVGKLNDLEEKNFIKGSYVYDKKLKSYNLKNEVAKERKNLKRFLDIFAKTGFKPVDNFGDNTHILFHKIYDIGNQYVHSKAVVGSPKEDARVVLFMVNQVLSDIFGLNSKLEGRTVKSGYSEFPDICKGLNFAIEFGLTIEAAQRIYYNTPSQKSYDAIKNMIGDWNGRWRDGSGVMTRGSLSFRLGANDIIFADLIYPKAEGEEITEPLEIRLFEGYVHLIGFDPKTRLHYSETNVSFELGFFDDNMLLGKHLKSYGKAIFERQSTE